MGRPRWSKTILVGATGAASALVVACGSQTVVKTVTTTRSAGTAASTPTKTSPPKPKPAQVGDTLTLAGGPRESLAVTVKDGH